MSDSNKDTVAVDVRPYVVGLEKVYLEKPEDLRRVQKIFKAIDLLKTWRSVYGDLENERAFRPVFAVIDALQEDQFSTE